jgi:hypothetical protein
MAGVRGSSSFALIVRRISSLAGTVTIAHESIGTGRSEISKRR